MEQIKSEKAKDYVWNAIPWAYLDCAVKAISIAETEAEERHSEQIEALKGKLIDGFIEFINDCYISLNEQQALEIRERLTNKLNEKQ